uniref:Cyclin N-terminal domain-containing protein n=1 Tax=Zea mays TaxID=4577 RepID=A0A804UDV8_MAIZE
MAPSSYEVAASILLCAEDSSSILDLEAEAEEEALLARSGEPGGGAEFPVPSEECVAGFLESEAAHMPREDYAERLRSGGMDLRVRTDAIDWIWKVHTCYGFGPLTACLAVNYLDRFLSLYQLPVRIIKAYEVMMKRHCLLLGSWNEDGRRSETRICTICSSGSVPVTMCLSRHFSGRQGLDDTAAVRGVLVPGRQDGGDLRPFVPGPAGELESNNADA